MHSNDLPPDLAERLARLRQLGDRLAQHRSALIEAAGEDTGTPCTTAGLEIDLAVEHLWSMEKEVPDVRGKPP